MIHLRNLAIALMCLAIGVTALRLPEVADGAIAREADRTRSLVIVEALELRRMLREDVLPQVNFGIRVVDDRSQQALVIVQDLGRKADTLAAKIETDANRQTSDALAIVKDAAESTITEVQGIRADLRPAIDSIPPAVSSVKALTDEAKKTWDQKYDEIQATIDNLTVATAGIGRAADEVAKAAPKLTESAIGIGKSADGIAADVHTATSDIVRPKSFWQRLRSWIELGGKLGIRLL